MKKQNKLFRRLLPFVFALTLAFALALPVSALEDDEFSGYSADTLTVKVGYFGGPYYEKAVFSLDQLWGMGVVYADYTFIDNMPSVVIDHVAGVRLADLMYAAGIDLNSIQTFYFWTRDKQGDYYTSYSKYALLDVPRYCFYSLPDNFDEETGQGNELAASDAAYVDTVIALADDWNRCIAGATFGSDYMNLNTNTRFRLIFGQTNTYERTANSSAKWIHEIVVELGGAPTLTLDASVLEGEVGSLLRTEASVMADSTVLANEKIVWTSSDESIATVDENGNISVHAKGTATITATFAGVSASVTVNGGGGAEENPEKPNPGEGEGDENTEAPPTETPGEEQVPTPEEPEASPQPSESPAPEETPIPTETPQPTESPKPVETPEPTATPTPSPSPEATETPTPVETPEPEPTPEINETPEPTQPVEHEAMPPEASSMAPVFQPVEVVTPDKGGIQNWREAEMSETATELANIEQDVPLAGIGIGSLGLLVGSAAVYAAIFYRNIRRE